MIESFENFTFECKVFALILVGIYDLFQSKQVALTLPFPDQVDSPKLSLAQDTFYHILASLRIAHGHSLRQDELLLL